MLTILFRHPRWAQPLIDRASCCLHCPRRAIALRHPLWMEKWKTPHRQCHLKKLSRFIVSMAAVRTDRALLCHLAAGYGHSPNPCRRGKKSRQDGACIAHRPGAVSALRFLTAYFMPKEFGHDYS
jgi:hypothetical protein